jgi:ERCC4-type nuclease
MLIDDFASDKPVIIYDTREARTHVLRHLKKFDDVTIIQKQLDIADYLVPSSEGTIAIERKRASDFLQSISDGRLFDQIENLKEYTDARLILEGGIFTSIQGNRCYAVDSLGKPWNPKKKSRAQPRTMWTNQFFIHPHSYIAIFKKIQESGITIIPTGGTRDTADILHYWATQGEKSEYLTIKRKPKTSSDYDIQLFLISGLTGVNTKRAESLLNEFGTPMRVFNAVLEHSPQKFPVDGIGEKTASDIKKILSTNVVNVKQRRIIEYEFRECVKELEDVLTCTQRELGKKNIPELKKLLRERGLKLTGKKDELVERLLGDMSEDERVDKKLFVKKYTELKKSKAGLHQIPQKLQKAYNRFKG